MTSTATVPTAVRLPVSLVERYTQLAISTGRSRTYYITQALEQSISELEYQYGLLAKVERYRAGELDTVTLDELEENLGLAD